MQELMHQSGGQPKDSLNEVGGRWVHLEKSQAPNVAREVFKIATSLGYYQPDFALYEKREKEYSRKLGLREPDVLSKSAKV